MTVAKHLASMMIAAATFALAAAPPAGAAGGGLIKRNSVALAACTTGDLPIARAATFKVTAVKGPKAHTVGVRFSLWQHRINPSGSRRMIVLPSWLTWTRSKPGRSALLVTRRIDTLSGPAEYYVKAQIRWYDSKGKTIASKTLTSDACEQPAYGPDLSLSVAPAPPPPPDPASPAPMVAAQSLPTYETGSSIDFVIANSGRDTSRPATLIVRASQQTQLATTGIPAIAAGQSVVVTLTLASCPAQASVNAAVIGSDRDIEPSYSNNERTIGRCAA